MWRTLFASGPNKLASLYYFFIHSAGLSKKQADFEGGRLHAFRQLLLVA